MMSSSNEQLLAYTTYAIQNGPYNASIASSASSSQTSVWSDAASQSSDDTSISTASSEVFENTESYFKSAPRSEVPQELRQNPRRTRVGASTRSGCPPVLVRQCERKHNFVDNLVDSSTQIVEAIWPCSSVIYRQELGSKAVLPLRTFIQETLRRSRTSYSTLQVALYYLILIKPHVPTHDFTMEQPDDVHVNRALQCGRRMFLAALILASKYLQDRNYSARAWSKISGLATNEINQNEMAFLLAVNWKLHITDAVFQRWTEIVLKYTPSQPPSPGAVGSLTAEMEYQDWKNLILRLNPELDNIEGLVQAGPSAPKAQDFPVSTPSPRLGGLLSPPRHASRLGFDGDATPTPKTYGAPPVMEPLASGSCAPVRLAPALGLLPTPRLTPQMTGPSTPAASAASCLLSGRGSMGFAMSQVANTAATQTMDRWYQSSETSPQGYPCLVRRSSLANSVSTASSPESMVSDTSRTSRSSSISSASSLVSAPFSNKLDVQARCRYAKLCSERYSLKPIIASVPETYDECRMTSSPEYYTGPVAKDLLDMSLDTPTTSRGCDFDDAADAARALQDLQKYSLGFQSRSANRLGTKRSCDALQDNVRELLTSQPTSTSDRAWPDAMISGRETLDSSRKRVCYEVPAYTIPSLHPAVGGRGGPGMWAGVLN
ncbi:uncharacterized protein B0I36DRAFT_66175 [Microdochium trichocladiopsis]|uniref:G1/S-specific cyclin pas1 n=1 Tax=Microdochium trichocladiopsis TaxID=1682393 RepID=A0A9P9BUG1_9PEZI|nr:uncharacterized protein B0I36DRAFT_66175 [Microdochium trichocladiopsis]KAH7037439.1 hypothetical protein B0I36DRAFT_66175 [Microdochium trichocladiopsis]